MNADPAQTVPARSASRTGRIECTLNHDPRLIASFGAIFAHAAMLAGFSEETQRDLGAAAVEASQEMLITAKGTESSTSALKLVMEEFPDRVELLIESSAGARPEGIRKRLEARIGERVQCDLREARLRVTLLKSCGAAKSGSTA